MNHDYKHFRIPPCVATPASTRRPRLRCHPHGGEKPKNKPPAGSRHKLRQIEPIRNSIHTGNKEKPSGKEPMVAITRHASL